MTALMPERPGLQTPFLQRLNSFDHDQRDRNNCGCHLQYMLDLLQIHAQLEPPSHEECSSRMASGRFPL